MKLQIVDIERSTCPVGAEIEIEGVGKSKVENSVDNLLLGIAEVYSKLTGISLEQELENGSFLRRIVLTAIDAKEKRVRILIYPAQK